MFVVDDLVGWLVGRLADAGYQKLATLLRGSDQARALKQAVTAAVQATVSELDPFDGEEPDRVAEQISKAFLRRDPVPLPLGQATLLEALQAGIAAQLSVRDDAGHPVVSVPGVPVGEVAARLTAHLVREIQIRGSQDGPLIPLAGQLNHDLTHLQVQRLDGRGQRLEGMLTQLLGQGRDALAALGSAAAPTGWPLDQVVDPFALEVHRPVEPDRPQPGLPVLPAYVPRGHDAALADVVAAAAAGVSRIVVLVGGSSTGKTRACWQALESLRGVEPGWRLWHPIDPQGALAELPGVGPRTVVWLNEAQRYLDTPDSAGEQVAAGLRELLRGQARGPVLALATLWPEFWDDLTSRPQGGADPHAQARELLAGHNITVPAAFTREQLRDLEGTGDPRLAQAAGGSRDGRVIQYLAGAPELLDRYHNAPPAARALIDAAMDVRRLGMGPALPRAFLEAAAPGYLTDADWDMLPGDWLEQALAYTARPSKGVRGPLTPIRPRLGPADGSAWQLADYLDQHGRRARRELILPAAFWDAAATCADPTDLTSLAGAAEDRGLLRDAARLYKAASGHGNARAGARLVRLLHTLHPGDRSPADWAATHASPDDPGGLAALLDALREIGATGQVAALLDRDPAAHVSLDDSGGVARLLDALRQAGATSQAATLARRAAAHISLDDPGAVARRFRALPEAEAATLARRAAAHISLDDSGAVARLLHLLPEAEAATLARRAAAHVSLDDPGAVAELLTVLCWAGATAQVAALLDRDPAAHVSLDDSGGVARLLDVLREAGAIGQVAALLDRDPAAHVSPDDAFGVSRLLDALREIGATGQVAALLDRDPAAHVSPDDAFGVRWLLDALREAGARAQAAELIERLPAAGLFRLFREQEGHGGDFQFGREANGRPAGRWSWTDLG